MVAMPKINKGSSSVWASGDDWLSIFILKYIFYIALNEKFSLIGSELFYYDQKLVQKLSGSNETTS